ncbi:MAG: ABC transporter ATP-binding protein [Candidatus Fournierella pullistercoris]|uniref:ABC transporter ATP-binding protein n=1 Tax=Candidatus Allofournierella pullistercoris TaxID=2838597 RepID=A0A948WRY8_9FIRM|nr:ABC transporter ATP-binding protein [Candidatus Fournierella pullistercoris]
MDGVSTNKTVVQAVDLTKVYGSGPSKVKAVNRVSFSIPKGEFAAITGPSGSGKSTLLHMMGGVEKPTKGNLLVNGTDLSSLSVNESAIFRRQNIGLVYQSYNLIPVLTVKENILLPLQLDHKKVNKEFFRHLVDRLGLADRLDHLPNQLSGGQQQRVSIGRALITRPSLLLADEPTGNLDSQNGAEIMELFHQFHRDGQTLVLITHDESIAAQAQRILQIQDGALVKDEVQGQ